LLTIFGAGWRISVVLALAPCGALAPSPGEPPALANAEPRLIFSEEDKDVAESLMPYLQEGRKKIEAFIGAPFRRAHARNRLCLEFASRLPFNQRNG
jgi:hypothetical protein